MIRVRVVAALQPPILLSLAVLAMYNVKELVGDNTGVTIVSFLP